MKPAAHGYLQTPDGHTPYWADYGARDADPLLLIHGGGGHLIDIDRMGAFNLTTQRVVVLHQRGIGLSLPFGEVAGNTVTANIEDMERLRATLGVEQWRILAWSFGATLAAGYALAHPGRVRDLICYAPYLGSDEDYQVLWKTAPDLAAKYMAFHQATTGKGIVTSVFNKASSPDDAARLEAYAAALKIHDVSLSEESIRAGMSDAEWDALSRARLVGATLDKSLFYELDRFLEHGVARRGAAVPATLVYGGNDHWSAPNAYASRVFNAVAVHTAHGAAHDIHDPRVQPILARILSPA